MVLTYEQRRENARAYAMGLPEPHQDQPARNADQPLRNTDQLLRNTRPQQNQPVPSVRNTLSRPLTHHNHNHPVRNTLSRPLTQQNQPVRNTLSRPLTQQNEPLPNAGSTNQTMLTEAHGRPLPQHQSTPARNKNKPTGASNLENLEKNRDAARDLHGVKSPEYTRINNKIRSMKRAGRKKMSSQTNQPATQLFSTADDDKSSIDPALIHQDFNLYKTEYANYSNYPIEEHKTISARTYGGHIINEILLPTLHEVQGLAPNSRIVEGGILELTPYDGRSNKLSNDLKNFLIHLVGKGFGKGLTNNFSFNDAAVAHDLLYRNKDSTVVVVVDYIYEDRATKKKMKATVGAALLTTLVKLERHRMNGGKSDMYPKTCKTYNLVQFTVLERYNRRELGAMSLKMMLQIMESQYHADLVFWCGCARRFYDKCGSTKNPKWIVCPFYIEETESENRDMFYYAVLNGGGKNNFQKNVVGFVEKEGRKVSISFKSTSLNKYYGVDDGKSSNKENNAAKQPEPSSKLASSVSSMQPSSVIIENPRTSVQKEDVKITYFIYAPEYKSGEVQAAYDDSELEVYGERSDGMGKKYEFSCILEISGIIGSTIDIDKCKVKGGLSNGVHAIAIELD